MTANLAELQEITVADAAATVKVETRIKQYVQLRDIIKDRQEEFDKAQKPLLELQTMLSGWFQTHLEKYGSDSVKTKEGTVYLSTRYTTSLADPDAFMKFVIEHGMFELLDRRANATAVKDYVQEKGFNPPGVNLNGMKTVGVRRSSK